MFPLQNYSKLSAEKNENDNKIIKYLKNVQTTKYITM